MNDSPSARDLLEVQAYFGLPSPALVEKDWYVVRALRAIAETETGPFRLVFGGGTALSRAHRLIQRMSEDRILSWTPGSSSIPNNSAQRESGNESRYTLYRLPYTPIAEGKGSLRPEIQIETALWPLRRKAINLPVISFMAEASKAPAEVPAIACVSLVETAAEKFVALTRRAGAELADAGGPRDSTLVRHIYDLHAIHAHYDEAEVVRLARTIMLADAEAYGHQFPAYRDNPIFETLRAVEGMRDDPKFAGRYTTFLRDMVYGKRHDLEAALSTLVGIAHRLEHDSGSREKSKPG